MSARHLAFGQQGEDLAFVYLSGQGYEMLERNWRCQPDELDIICKDQDMLVFVEVKTRRPGKMNAPYQGLTPKKCRSLLRGASGYLSSFGLWDMPCRFDLLSVIIDKSGEVVLEHSKDILSFTDIGPESDAWQPW